VWLVVVFGNCWIGLGDGENLVIESLYEEVVYDGNECSVLMFAGFGVWIGRGFSRFGRVSFSHCSYS
jgi:hypothetical protein